MKGMKLAKQKTVFHESYGYPKSAHQHEMDCPVWSTGATIQDTALTGLSPRHHLYINGTRFLFHICKLLPAFFMERESKEVFLCTYSLKILQKESTNLTNNSIKSLFSNLSYGGSLGFVMLANIQRDHHINIMLGQIKLI